MDKAAYHGLTFRYDVGIDGDILKSPISDSYKEFMRGAYSVISPRYYRVIGEAPRKMDDGTHINVNETIDRSVFDRWRHENAYRPPNLEEWAKRHNVTAGDIHQSVMADDPNVAAALS
jgi:hypothetical protein